MAYYIRVTGLFLILLFIIPAAGAQEWYFSNPAGMALQKSSSRMVALHSAWALSVERASRSSLPPILKPFDNSAYTLEQRLLYERGALKRRQWIFRDAGNITRVNASLPADLATIGKVEGGEIPPFIEVFSVDRSLIETHQYLASGVYITKYSYRNGLLIKADSFLDKEPLWSDTFRYTRSNLLRKVERVFYKAGTAMEAAQGRNNQPPTIPETPANLDLREAPPVSGFVNPGSPYDSSIMTEVLEPIYSVSAARIVYDTDNQGRVISETRYDKDDKVLAEITNEWSGDRIRVIRWSAGPDQGRIVFRYSGKDRVGEEDYRNGELERTVKTRGNEEIEEIYMNGKPILRAIWQNGRKVSEERLR
ncbi:MAG: hypothetical protein LBB72_03900 [Spirochaetaceae bacterium]|nr:hypothetical protein [Spirochaetaceae bacterium]